MKFLLPSVFVSMLVAAVSCAPDNGRELSDYSNPTTGDSLLYYLGQLRAHEYWEDANADTTLRSREQRDKYIEGIRKGMDAIKRGEDEATYNKGVRMGARMARNILEFEKLYGVELDHEVLFESIVNGLAQDRNISPLDYQNMFYSLIGEFKTRARDKDRKRSHLSLIEEARERKLSKISDDLYYRIIRKGSGPYAHHGDEIYIAVTYQLADGEDIGMPSPEMVTLGKPGVPEVLNRAYSRLTKGSSGVFATTAESVFATRSEIMGIKPSDVLIINITLNDIVSNLDEDSAPMADSIPLPD